MPFDSQQKITLLINASDHLLQNAHKFGYSTFKSQSRLNTYNRYIKSSLNCLITLVTTYKSSLDTSTESKLCYKLAQLLFSETGSFDLALEYCTRGIQICARSGDLYRTKIRLELLSFEIQYREDRSFGRKSTLKYLNTLFDQVPEFSPNLRSYLLFVKYRYFGMNFSEEQRITLLETCINDIAKLVNGENFSLYCLVQLEYVKELLNQHKPIGNIRAAFERLQYKLESDDALSCLLPVQIRASVLLLDFIILSQENNLEDSKSKIVIISGFIKKISQDPSNGWGQNSKFRIDIGLQDLHNHSFRMPLDVSWLTSKEFVALAYFYFGVSYLPKSWDGHNRTEKLLFRCQTILEKLDQERIGVISPVDMEKNVLSRRLMSLLINSYAILSSMQSGHLEERDVDNPFNKQIVQFIEDYDGSKFSSQELVVYHKMVPILFYLWALYYQQNGDFNRAKYYYLKVRELHSSIHNELSAEEFFSDSMLVTFLQLGSGLSGSMFESKGLKSELYVVCTLNLLSIVLYELFVLRENAVLQTDSGYKQYIGKLSDSLNLKDLLTKELQNIDISKKSSTTDKLLLRYTVLCLEYAADESKECLTDKDFQDIDEISHISPFLVSVMYYIAGKTFKFSRLRPEVDNINSRVKLFSKSYQESMKSLAHPNMIGYMSTLQIYLIIRSYRNYFDEKQLCAVEQQLKELRPMRREDSNVKQEK